MLKKMNYMSRKLKDGEYTDQASAQSQNLYKTEIQYAKQAYFLL